MLFKGVNKSWQLARDRIRRNLGVLLFDHKVAPVICPIADLQHVVFIRWDAKWGDAIVSSLMIAPLRKAYPDIKITIVTSAALADYFENYLNVDQVIVVQRKPTYRQLSALAQKLKPVDLLIHFNMHMKMKDLYLLNKVRARQVAGLDDDIGRVNLKLGKQTQGLHFAQKLVYLLRCLGIEVENPEYHVPHNAEAMLKADDFLANQANNPLLVINSFGGDKSRRLNNANTGKIISAILDIQPTINIVVLSTPVSENEVHKLCLNIAKSNVFYYPESSTIYDAIALVSKADWVVSVDTAIVHIAAGLNKPLLALYNPDKLNYSDWHPNSGKAISCFSENTSPPDINALAWQNLLPSLAELFKL
ncbi:LOS biosynthesis enzyme LBGB [methanotrophic bacterial endosymbiont of Bathymodiolus sp.]|nr:LOS biosynthesis enzyme LBGB [methanotrophic bacterial endosymbiont of Bathymodiolus sp.]